MWGGRQVDPANLPSTGGPVVPPWMNKWTDLSLAHRDLCGLHQVAVSMCRVTHPQFEYLCVMQVLRHGALPDFYLVRDASDSDLLKRVVGDSLQGESVLWWAPKDADSIRAAIERLMRNDGLC